MKMQFFDKVWRVLFILIFAFSVGWIPITPAQAQAAQTIEARWNEDSVGGYGWPLGEFVDVYVDDPATPLVNPDYSGSAQVETPEWEPENTWFYLELEEYDLKVGDLVTVTYQTTSKQLTLTGVEITNVDSDANFVEGTAAPTSAIEVWVCGRNGCSEKKQLAADGNGDWSTDFDDVPAFDIQTGATAIAAEWDEDDDGTFFFWEVPNPTMDVWYQDGNISAYGWPLDTELTLTIGDLVEPEPDFSTTTNVGTAPWDPNQTLGEFYIGDVFTILPGMTLTVSGATLTKQLVIADLTITNIDTENDIITGEAGIDQMMWMWYESTTDTCCRDFQANGSGVWTVDYSEPGPNGEPTEDIGPGSSGTINARDEDDDNTSLSWRVPNPNFEVNARTDEVTAREWEEGTDVSLTIEGVSYGSVTMGPAPWNPDDIVGQFYLDGVYDIQAGDVVTVQGSGVTKVLTVTPIQVTDLSAAANTISGIASNGSSVTICADTPTGCYIREVTASDPGGAWSVDFGTEFTLEPGWGGWVEEWDEDGDGSWDNWRVPNPRIEGRTNFENVEAFEWPLGATVTLEIDDPSTPLVDPDYTDTGTVEIANWDPNQTYVYFGFNGIYDLKPGDIISLTDGTTTKQHTLTGLTITDVDPATDIVTGTAEAESHVSVWACEGNNCPTREVDADLAGNWSTDFGDPSQPTLDIGPGTWVDSGQWEDDGDGTLFGWTVPNRHIVGDAQDNWIHAREWDEGTTVTLTINGVSHGSAVVTDPQPWDPSMFYADFDLAGYDVQVDDVITVSGDGTTKVLTVSPLEVTGINLTADTISGVTTPGAAVSGSACLPDTDCVNRSATADGTSGLWSMDFHEDLDLVPGVFGWVQEWDEDGDGTEDGWGIPIIDINVRVGEIDQTYPVPAQTSTRVSYAVDSGPVKIASTDGTPIIASERINLLNHPAVSSYTEFMGLPATQVTDTYLFPWYNNVSLDSQLRIANVGSAPTIVNVKIGTLVDENIPLGINDSRRLKYTVDTGPVVITSSDNVSIIASERINLLNHPSVSSYTEFIGLLGSDIAGTRYLFPWYNNSSLDSQLRFANVGSAPTTVTVKIGDQVNETFSLGINQSRREKFLNVDAGPVEVTSTGGVPIIVSERVNLLNHPAVSSYSELIGLPGTTITHTKYLFPWYNNVSLDSQLRIANVGNDSTTVTVKIGTQVDDSFTLGANQSVRKTYNADTGPVVIESSGGVPIIASERVNLLNHPVVASYSEFIGLSVGDPLGWPGNQLSDTYWFPWYNNVSLDSQLRFGVP